MMTTTYEDVLARRNRPLIMLMTCKIEKVIFKKPAKSRLAVRPMGHPQKRLPESAVPWADIAKGAASDAEAGVQICLIPRSQIDDWVGSAMIVQELLICVKDKMMMKRDQNIPKPANIFVLCKTIRKTRRGAAAEQQATHRWFL